MKTSDLKGSTPGWTDCLAAWTAGPHLDASTGQSTGGPWEPHLDACLAEPRPPKSGIGASCFLSMCCHSGRARTSRLRLSLLRLIQRRTSQPGRTAPYMYGCSSCRDAGRAGVFLSSSQTTSKQIKFETIQSEKYNNSLVTVNHKKHRWCRRGWNQHRDLDTREPGQVHARSH